MWRCFHPNEFQYTWKKRNPLIMSRIDYVLAPLGTLQMINNCEIQPACISDHCSVTFNLALNASIRGPGYWKLNVRHLTSSEFVNQMNETLDFVEFRYDNRNPLNRWEMLKHDARQTAMSYSCAKATQRKKM